MRAFEEYWGGLKRKCYEIGEMTITKTLDTKRLILLGNMFEIEICGARKKDVKCIMDHIDRFIADELKNPLYPLA